MTYCLGIKLDAGLVFASDSRITAGIDYISTYRKLHAFTDTPGRQLRGGQSRDALLAAR